MLRLILMPLTEVSASEFSFDFLFEFLVVVVSGKTYIEKDQIFEVSSQPLPDLPDHITMDEKYLGLILQVQTTNVFVQPRISFLDFGSSYIFVCNLVDRLISGVKQENAFLSQLFQEVLLIISPDVEHLV